MTIPTNASGGGCSLDQLVGRHIIHNCPMPEMKGGKIEYWTDKRDVVLMAVNGRYAMVRRPRAMPYIAKTSELETPPNGRDELRAKPVVSQSEQGMTCKQSKNSKRKLNLSKNKSHLSTKESMSAKQPSSR